MTRRRHKIVDLGRLPVRSCLALALVALSGPAAQAPAPRTPLPRFEEGAAEAGLKFVHQHGGQGRKYLVETMGSGVCLLDYDRDGRVDVYLVQSGSHRAEGRAGNQLYRNRGDGTFQLIEDSGAEDQGYGMGCACGDYDNDGWTDIYVANFGANSLLRNQGDGTFKNQAPSSGVDDPGWSVSAAFADVDRDGDLDLYVANYLDFSYQSHVQCGDVGAPSYCHPDVYPAAPNSFFMNQGGGSFRRANRESGLSPDNPEAGKTLGVLFFDLDDDGDLDLYAANDSTANFLFENLGQGRFADVSLFSGAAYNRDGKTEAGMGVDAGDLDGDGLDELIVTHLDFETNTLYRNEGSGRFSDRSDAAGIGGPSRTRVGFGVNFGDFNLDGALDLFVANGHVIDDISRRNPTLSHAQPNQLLLNDGRGRFSDVSARTGDYFQRRAVSRGSAMGDLDNDGDLDLVVSNNNGAVDLLWNRLDSGNWLVVELEGVHCSREAIGARIWLDTEKGKLVREVRGGSGYASHNDFRVHFGLGAASKAAALEVRWPCGRRQTWKNIEGRRRIKVREGQPDVKSHVRRTDG